MDNINPKHKDRLFSFIFEFLGKCKILEEYSWFIERIRVLSDTLDVSDAVNTALKEMPDDFALKQFLLIHKAEVTDMCITEYDEAETLKAIGNEKYAECKADDIDIVKSMANAGDIPDDLAQKIIEKLSMNPK